MNNLRPKLQVGDKVDYITERRHLLAIVLGVRDGHVLLQVAYGGKRLRLPLAQAHWRSDGKPAWSVEAL